MPGGTGLWQVDFLQCDIADFLKLVEILIGLISLSKSRMKRYRNDIGTL